MPVVLPPGAGFLGKSRRRISASGLVTWERCPRQWHYRRRIGLNDAIVPEMIIGLVVEDALCGIYMERFSSDKPTPIVSTWVNHSRQGDGLQKIESSAELQISDIDSINEWLEIVLPILVGEVQRLLKKKWDESPWKSNQRDISEVDDKRIENLLRGGINLQIEEVQNCFNNEGGPYLDQFRESGDPFTIPAPCWDENPAKPGEYKSRTAGKGFKSGSITAWEAWEIARPWFVDPDAGLFTQQAILPEGWFQGEYDLVYRWDNGVKIVDLKASDGTSEWAASYPVQMKTYAWLWWAIHERKELVSGLETWYLGCSKRKSYEIPSIQEMEKFEKSLHSFWEENVANKGKRSIENYPPNPAPVPRFSEGGGEKSGEGSPEARCISCSWAEECEGSGRKRSHTSTSEYSDNKGETYQLQKIDSVTSRISVEGRIRSWKPNKWQFGGISPAFSLRTDSGEIWCSPYKGGPMNIDENIGEGKLVRVVDAYLSPTRRGSPQLKIDHLSTIEIIEEDEKRGLVSPNSLQRINLRGRIMSLSYSEGETNWGKWRRWGAELSTPDSSIEISAMSENIPFCYDEVKRGDEVVVLNGFSTAFGDKQQISFDAQTKLIIL